MFESGFERTFFVGIALLAVTACGRSRRVYVVREAEPSAKVVRIGEYASLSGADAEIGGEYHRGFGLACDEWNMVREHFDKRYGPDPEGVRVALVTYDDQSRPAAAATAVQRLITDDQIALVAGGWNAERAGAAAVSASNALVVCTGCPADGDARVLGLAPSLHERVEVLADLVVKTMNMTKVAILVRQDVANDRAAADAFHASLKSRNVSSAAIIAFTPATIGDVLSKLVTDAPQAVLVTLDGNEAAFVGRAMRRRAVPSALLFLGAPNLAVLPDADRLAALEGALFPSSFEPSRTDFLTVNFTQWFHVRHSGEPTEREFLGYAAAVRLIMAACCAETDAARVTAQLAKNRSWLSLAIMRVEHGTFVRALPPQH